MITQEAKKKQAVVKYAINLLEGDFFSWYSAKEQWDTDLWETIIKIITCIDEYSTFSFEIIYEPVDIFKDLYMSIIPKTVRHSMGEYFTLHG